MGRARRNTGPDHDHFFEFDYLCVLTRGFLCKRLVDRNSQQAQQDN